MKNSFKKTNDTSKSLRRRPYGDTVERTFKIQMTLSVMAIVACIVALFSTTFAFYYKELDSGSNSISAASWSLDVTYHNEDDKKINGAYTLKLAKDEIHSFTIAPNGSATEGYCIINVKDEKGTTSYTTWVFESTENISLNIMAKEGTVISFKAYWGEPADPISDENNGTLNIRHSYNIAYSYTVKSGDTIEDIAKYYGVEAEDILVYNGIESLSDVSEGELIGIIGSDVTTEYYNRSVDREYEIKVGDNLSGIANMFNVPMKDLMLYNKITDVNDIKAGETLIIPSWTAVLTTAPETTTAVPETTTSPETTTAVLETTAAPETTTAPETTAAPTEETTQKPEPVSEPVSSETSAAPETTAAPTGTETPAD